MINENMCEMMVMPPLEMDLLNLSELCILQIQEDATYDPMLLQKPGIGAQLFRAGISHCMEIVRLSDDDVSVPESPEELSSIIVEAQEGSPQPGACLPQASGDFLPAFPQVGVPRVRGPPDVMPLFAELYDRMLHLDAVHASQQRTLDVGRDDLLNMRDLVEGILHRIGIDPRDPRLEHQCRGGH